MKVVNTVIFYLLGVFGIICISVFPHYFTSTGLSNPLGYFENLGSFILGFIQPDSWVYQITDKSTYDQNSVTQGNYPLIETLWEPYIYSMQIFLGAILLGFFLAFILAFSVNFLPKPILKIVKRILDVSESIPDLVIAVLLQMLSVYVYKKSGLDLFRVAGYMDAKVYFAPIITLAILPMISLFKILLFRIEEEFMKDYVGFLKSKGIQKTRILVRHILKNVLPITFHHSKIIIWATLSSQFVIEYLFNINGLISFIINSFTPMTIAVSLILVFTPFFVLFQLIDLWLYESPIYRHEVSANKKHTFQPFQSFKEWMSGIWHIRWYQIRPWRPITYACVVLMKHMKNYKFAIGSLFFIIMISVSVIYSNTTDSHVDQERIIYKEDGTIKSTPPHPPGVPFLLGSDQSGFDLLDQLIIGAKYTLVFGLLIALLRVLTGLLGGIVFAFSLNDRKQGWIEKLIDSIHFLPLTVIAYILLQPILFVGRNMESTYTLSERIILEIIILTILVIPLTTVLIGNDIKHILKNEFVMSAKVLGGSKIHILWCHVLPHIGPRLTILFGQQFIQVLFIFMHLGLFRLFFGGTLMDDPPRSISYEWSGLVGSGKGSIGDEHYWIILWPLLAFMFSIFAMQLIVKGVKEVQQAKIGVLYKFRKKGKWKRKVKVSNYVSEYEPTAESFRRVDNDRI